MPRTAIVVGGMSCGGASSVATHTFSIALTKTKFPKKVRLDEDLSTRIFQIGPRAAFGDHHSVSCALYNRFAQKPVVAAPKQ